MTVEEMDLIKRGWDYEVRTWTRKAQEPVGIVGFVATVTINAPHGTFHSKGCASIKGREAEAVFKTIHQTYNEAIDAFARTKEGLGE